MDVPLWPHATCCGPSAAPIRGQDVNSVHTFKVLKFQSLWIYACSKTELELESGAAVYPLMDPKQGYICSG